MTKAALCHWAAVAKCTANPIFGQLFGLCNSKDEKLLEMQQMARDAISHVNVLTENQRTVEWFSLRAFHLSATMAELLFNSNYDNKTDGELLTQLCKSWFSWSRSTQAMVIGAKNESAVLQAFSKLSYVRSIFGVGLLENKHIHGWPLHQTEWQLWASRQRKMLWHPLNLRLEYQRNESSKQKK
jgi:hypothetical protein